MKNLHLLIFSYFFNWTFCVQRMMTLIKQCYQLIRPGPWYLSDGSSEIDAHIRSNLCYLIWLRHLMRSRAVTNRFFFSPRIPFFLQMCATCSKIPSTMNTSLFTVFKDTSLHLCLNNFVSRFPYFQFFSPIRTCCGGTLPPRYFLKE